MGRGLKYSYKMLPFPSNSISTGKIYRPMIPVTLQYKSQPALDTMMLLDSGADFSMIDRDFAEALGIEIDILKKDTSEGIGGKGAIAWVDLHTTFGTEYAREYKAKFPFHILLDKPLPLHLLGREPLFYYFDVHFRLAYAYPKGKIVLDEVIKTRDPDRYK